MRNPNTPVWAQLDVISPMPYTAFTAHQLLFSLKKTIPIDITKAVEPLTVVRIRIEHSVCIQQASAF